MCARQRVDDVLQWLQRGIQIEEIWILNEDIAIDKLRKLITLLCANVSLRVLRIQANCLTETGIKALFTSLVHHPTLKEIDLMWQHITVQSAHHIADYLKMNTTLESLNLWCTRLFDSCGVLLADALRFNSRLKSIDIGGNTSLSGWLTESGKAFASMLQHNNTLERWSANCIGSNFTDQFTTALSTNSSITHIYLSGNELCSRSVQAISTAIQCNPSMIHVNLSQNENGFDVAATSALADTLVNSTTFHSLKLWGNEIQIGCMQRLKTAMNQSTSAVWLDTSPPGINTVRETIINHSCVNVHLYVCL